MMSTATESSVTHPYMLEGNKQLLYDACDFPFILLVFCALFCKFERSHYLPNHCHCIGRILLRKLKTKEFENIYVINLNDMRTGLLLYCSSILMYFICKNNAFVASRLDYMLYLHCMCVHQTSKHEKLPLEFYALFHVTVMCR